MHTIFINTSGKNLENNSDIFEVQHETKRLVSLECPLAEWNDEEKGYKACVHKIGELIDSYKDINNDFNLIIYVDLLSYELYASVPLSRHRERYACLKVLHSILKHYINVTFIAELNECGRVPRETLLIFEENQPLKDGDEVTEDGKNLIRSFARSFLGFPAEGEIDIILYGGSTAEDKSAAPELLCEKIIKLSCPCLGETLLQTYWDEIDTFISEAASYEASEQPLRQLLDRIIDCRREDDKTIFSVSLVTNRRASVVNKQENARRNLRLCLYVLSCVEEETVLDKETLDNNEPSVKPFPEINWDDVAEKLTAKRAVLRRKYEETLHLSEKFSDMRLAPKLYTFDNQRFALDEHGRKAKAFDIVDAEKEKDDEQKGKDVNAGIVRPKDKKAVVAKDVNAHGLFSNEEFPKFDYRGDSFDEKISESKATAEQYIAVAPKLRQHHLDYLQRFKAHVSEILSNYSGSSEENFQALLRKRKVSVSEEDFEDSGRDYRYTNSGGTEETKRLETVEDISETAYKSTLENYLQFCAGRSVAVTDIEEQCNWFVTRVRQIEESLRKLHTIATGLIFSIIALYIPFVVLQWESITMNMMTVAVALMSVAAPIVLLSVIFSIACMIQRRKYHKAWKEFKEQSDLVLKENAVAAKKYDELLSAYIPALRWVYEYRLDVEFYAECCKMARAKIGHHIQKLHDRVVAIGNIIEDLEIDTSEHDYSALKTESDADDEIDYNVSFCSGKKNRRFYSIIDTHFTESTHE